MAIVPLLIQLISGAAGGNIAGTLLKNLPLSKILQTVLGGVGGGLGGLLLSVLGVGGAAAAGVDPAGVDPVGAGDVAGAVGGLDLGSILQGVGGGGAGGGILVAIVGMIKKMMGGQNPG